MRSGGFAREPGARGIGKMSQVAEQVEIGEMSEWSIEAVLKTARVKALVGSNPTLSSNPSRGRSDDACAMRDDHPGAWGV